MRIQEQFEVEAPAEAAWAYLTDPPQIVPCLPGAELTEVVDDETYRGKVEVKVGPIEARYEGTVVFDEIDFEGMSARITASGEQQGAVGKAEADITLEVTSIGDARSKVSVQAEVSISGRLGRIGGGMIQTVSGQLFRKFAECVSEELRAN